MWYTFPGNSFYGYTVMNKSKHLDVGFCSEEKTGERVNDPRFMSLEEFDDGCYEVNVWDFDEVWASLGVVYSII